jgi:hypothetical protein
MMPARSTTTVSPFLYYAGSPRADDPLAALFHAPEGDMFEAFAHMSLAPDDLAIADFALEQHRITLQHWLAARGEAALPPAAAIDPFALRKALGYLLILEPNAAFDDFRYRLYGSQIVEWYKRDMTGRWVSEFPSRAAAVYGQQYRALRLLRRPIYCEHDASPDVSAMVRWCRLILPYAGEDGEIARILVSNVPCARERRDTVAMRRRRR